MICKVNNSVSYPKVEITKIKIDIAEIILLLCSNLQYACIIFFTKI